ncbi:MAG TPA: alpha/beta fold hydrolase [Rugosimonospora sp.]|nr:alpha/beta fold hydrolase [Rugosimonospora sp.]
MPETFVLITGACHGGWSWRLVAEHLRAAGHRVLTPTLPGLADGDDPRRHSLADVVDFVVDLVERNELQDVTLVGHSWGGYPLTGAAHRLAPRLRKLVYWSAFVPAEGAPLMDEVPPHYAELFTKVAAGSGNNSVLFPWEVFAGAFMQDADEPRQRLVHGLLTPQPMQYFTGTVPPVDPAALGVPASYVLSADDISLPPGEYHWAPRFPQRLGDVPVIEAPGSHEAQFTRPAELAAALLKA